MFPILLLITEWCLLSLSINQMKPRRPTSGPQRIVEKQWQPPPSNWQPPSRVTSESPVGHSHVQPNLLSGQRSNGPSPNNPSPSVAMLANNTYPQSSSISSAGGGVGSGGSTSPYGNGIPSPHQVLSHYHHHHHPVPQGWGLRPTSLDVPHSLKISSEFVSDLPDRHRIASPVSQSLGAASIINNTSTRSHPHPNPHYHPAAAPISARYVGFVVYYY